MSHLLNIMLDVNDIKFICVYVCCNCMKKEVCVDDVIVVKVFKQKHYEFLEFEFTTWRIQIFMLRLKRYTIKALFTIKVYFAIKSWIVSKTFSWIIVECYRVIIENFSTIKSISSMSKFSMQQEISIDREIILTMHAIVNASIDREIILTMYAIINANFLSLTRQL